MITDIKFDCIHCGQRMVVDAEAEGLATECPSCRTSITIPNVAALNDREYQGAGRKREAVFSSLSQGRDTALTSFEDPDVAALRQELLDASTQISRLESEIAELRSAASASTQAAEQTRTSFEKLQAERRRLRDELVTFKADLSSKETALRELTETRREAEKRATHYAAELARVEKALAELQEESGQLRSENQALSNERAQLLPKLEAAESEAAAAANLLRERETEIAELRTTLTETQSARTAALRDLSALEELSIGVEVELNTARARIAQLESELEQTSTEFAATQKRLADAEETAKSLTICVQELEKERDALRKSLSENTAGKDLVEVREHLRVTEKERDSLSARVEQLSHELERSGTERRSLNEQLRALLRELDEARRRAEAASEVRLRQDNEVLRGIIARQNAELEQRHIQIVRMKRARLGLRLAYAAFFVGLLGVAVWAAKVVPGLHLGNLF